MSLFDQINEDIKTAMKAKEKEKLEALRYLKSLLLKNKTDTKPIDEATVAINHAKKLNDSLSLFPEGDPAIAKTKQEIEFLKPYLPQPMTEQEVVALIDEIVSGLDKPNMGQVMGKLSGQIKGKFDGKKASDLVKSKLA